MNRKKDRRKRRQKQQPHPTGRNNKILLKERLLSFLRKKQKSASLTTIVQGIGLPKYEHKIARELLIGLEKAGKVSRHKKQWQIKDNRDKGGLVKATLSLTSKGFGFAVLEGQVAKQQKDIFIPASEINAATHGDTIMVQLARSSRNRPEGRVVEVVKRAFTHLCGIFIDGGKACYVTPDNEKMPFTVQIDHNCLLPRK